MPPKCNEERGHYVEKFGGSRCLYFVVPPCLERSRSDGFLRTGDGRARDENMGDDARRHQACNRDFYSRGRGEVPGRSAKDAYDKEKWIHGHETWTQNGYIYVVQDCRGRFESEGDWYPFFAEQKDGYDTLAWIHAQPWS